MLQNSLKIHPPRRGEGAAARGKTGVPTQKSPECGCIPALSRFYRFSGEKLLLVGLLARLIGNAAAGLASALAGGLALAATAVLDALGHITGIERENVFHWNSHPFYHFVYPYCTHFPPACQGGRTGWKPCFVRAGNAPFCPASLAQLPARQYTFYKRTAGARRRCRPRQTEQTGRDAASNG